MSQNGLVELLIEVAALKHIPRMGWAQHGVPNVESVAEHSFGVAFVALALASSLESEQDGAPNLEQVLVMALLHDLAEVRLTDLPASAVRLLPPEVKVQAEGAALADLLAPLPAADKLLALWQAFEGRASPEARLVRDADKLEMMIQCLRYERAGSTRLDEFWQAMDQNPWHYPVAADAYQQLRRLRAT